MEDISPSPVESGFLTAPHSGRPTPSTTQGTLYTSDEQLNDNYEIQEKVSDGGRGESRTGVLIEHGESIVER